MKLYIKEFYKSIEFNMFHDPVENIYGIRAKNLFLRHNDVYFHYRTGDGHGSICFWRVDYCAVFVAQRSCIETLSVLKDFTHCLEKEAT